MFYCDNLKIRDTFGRERIFRGVNICIKHHTVHSVEKFTKNDAKKLKDVGVNIVRLGITWAALEPRENKYNDKLIDSLCELIKELGKHDIFVMFDLHQDLFAHYFHGDGAPKWAIAKEYPNERPFAIWAEGYFYMQGVQNAFYDFWTDNNEIQTKFIKMWKYVSDKLADCDNIIGYDYFNEPYVHENGRKIFTSIVSNVMKISYGRELDFEHYFKKVKDKHGFALLALKVFSYVRTRKRLDSLLTVMDSTENFGKAVEGLEKYTDNFNRNYYQPFFNKISEDVNDKGVFNFFEHNYYSNLGIPFEIEHKVNDVYSPHAYDLFIDSPFYNKYSSDNRIRYILSAIRENQLKMNVPVLFGEWGGGAPGHDWIKHIDFIMGEFEKYHWSSIYWGYDFKNHNLEKIFNRPYPVAVCGDITEIKTDSENRIFTLKWTCENDFSDNIFTEIYEPQKGIVKYPNKLGENEVKIEY